MTTQTQATNSVKGRPVDPSSKAQRAISIFDEMHAAGAARKDIIKRFQDDLGMTKSGAATYHQNIKKTKGLVKSEKSE